MTGRLTPRQEPDVVIIGAGTFGSVLAATLTGVRTLLLESGPWERTEHVQNAPLAEETVPPPRLLEPGTDAPSTSGGRWRVPWRSRLPYQGLVYGVGGRSLFWGGYCVWPEIDAGRWPAEPAADLRARYLPAAARLLGLRRPGRHFGGVLNQRLRERLLDALAADRLPGLRSPDTSPAGRDAAGGLDMPMAIEAVEDAGAPRLVRFSSAPLLAGRLPDRDLEVLTGCHVRGLHARDGRIVAVETGRGLLRVSGHAAVVLAVGTIENARMVLGAAGLPPAAHAVHDLTTHLRSNVTVRVPIPFADGSREWGAAALHLRGDPADAGGRFHHQITGYGVGALPGDAARRLYTETPRYDMEALDPALRVRPRHLVITLASVAEMAADGVGTVSLLPERDEYGVRRARVDLSPGPADLRTWDRMDRSADAVVRALVGSGPVEVLRSGRFVPADAGRLAGVLDAAQRREPLGCGHHEMGTLRMGDDPRSSHTDADGRVHGTANLYVAGPAVFPALGSAGPVLPGIALTLRLADHLRDAVPSDAVAIRREGAS